MCTAICLKTNDGYFGRNLDYYCDYGQTVTVTPRNFPFEMRFLPKISNHYALIGMAAGGKEYPLYFDAANEKGLAAAGLNFPNNAFYTERGVHGKINIAPFEFIPYILGKCGDIKEAENLLSEINIVNHPFSENLVNTPLHWMISDGENSLTVEPVKGGVSVIRNEIGLLTNNPPFETQMLLLQNYLHLSPAMPQNRFSNKITAKPYSLGMGAIGLPGDLSSPSRFVRAAFAKSNISAEPSEGDSVEGFFHLLKSVAQIKGLTLTSDNQMEYTMYSCCMNLKKGVYYYTTYKNSCITAVDMWSKDVNGSLLINFPLRQNFAPYFEV